MSQQLTVTAVNGVDVSRLFETIESIRALPNLADFQFQLANKWIDCGLNRSTIKGFHGAGGEQASSGRSFVLDADEPPVLLGADRAANPVEYLLHALTACVTTSIVYHAAAKGIKIRKLESRTEGDLDLRGFLGMDDSVPRGFKKIRIRFKIEADAPAEKLAEIVNLGPTYSPVFDTVTRAVDVTVGLDR
jgi:uncharacterized OsmC-like protein